jgi:hypothetical protein
MSKYKYCEDCIYKEFFQMHLLGIRCKNELYQLTNITNINSYKHIIKFNYQSC